MLLTVRALCPPPASGGLRVDAGLDSLDTLELRNGPANSCRLAVGKCVLPFAHRRRVECVQRRENRECNALGLARGDRECSLNDGQIPNPNVARVAPGTGCHRVEGNRRASRNGRVSHLPPETHTVTTFVCLWL
jgi:hypothetical protein